MRWFDWLVFWSAIAVLVYFEIIGAVGGVLSAIGFAAFMITIYGAWTYMVQWPPVWFRLSAGVVTGLTVWGVA